MACYAGLQGIPSGLTKSTGHPNTVDSKKLEHGCRMIYGGVPSFCGLGSEDAMF